MPLKNKDSTDTGISWQSAPTPQTSSHSDSEASQTNSTSPAPSNSQHSSISDGFVRISGGSFKMGSPSMTAASSFPQKACRLGKSV